MRILGHRVHPYLIPFPIGLLATSVAFDVLYLVQDNSTWAEVSYWIIAGGIVGGLVAGVFGFLDWLVIPSGTRAKTVGIIHALTNVTMLAVFGSSWLLRYANEPTEPGWAAITLGFVGLGLALLGGWLGGELVERLGVGVHRDANPNARSSLEFGIGKDS